MRHMPVAARDMACGLKSLIIAYPCINRQGSEKIHEECANCKYDSSKKGYHCKIALGQYLRDRTGEG